MSRNPPIWRRGGLTVLIAAMAVACNSPGPSSLTDSEVEVLTEVQYPLGSVESGFEALIEFTLTKRGGGLVYVPANCLGEYDVRVEKEIGDTWTSAVPFYGRVLADCGEGTRIELEEGGTWPGALSLLSVRGVPQDEVRGIYRLVVPDVVSPSGEHLGPIRSEAFTVGTI